MLSSKNLERVDGIEPTSSAWKAAALPLCYTRAKNALPQPCERLAFPHPIPFLGFRPLGLETRVVGEEGLEPSKLSQRIYSPPPLPLGTFPQRAFSKPVWIRNVAIFRSFSLRKPSCPATPEVEEAPDPKPWGPNRRPSYSVVISRTQRPENR